VNQDEIKVIAPRRMEQVEVYRGREDHVVIKQFAYGEDPTILLHPSQVPILVQWLQEVAAEIQSNPLTGLGEEAQEQISE
jgi:hypothetical protein